MRSALASIIAGLGLLGASWLLLQPGETFDAVWWAQMVVAYTAGSGATLLAFAFFTGASSRGIR